LSKVSEKYSQGTSKREPNGNLRIGLKEATMTFANSPGGCAKRTLYSGRFKRHPLALRLLNCGTWEDG
jgi:hypothetical protein